METMQSLFIIVKFKKSPEACEMVDRQWRTQDFIWGGINLTKFSLIIARDISKKTVVMQV